MAFDVFPSAVYGILADEAVADRIEEMRELVEELLAKEKIGKPEDEYERFDETVDDFNRVISGNFRPWEDLLQELDAPKESQLMWTGSDDDRFGRCSTPPEAWIIGIGIFGFPNDIQFSEKFKKAADWHLWATGG